MSSRSMPKYLDRRRFIGSVVGGGCAAAVLSCFDEAIGEERAALPERLKAPYHTLTVISGTPRERGFAYGHRSSAGIRRYLDREIYPICKKGTNTLDKAFRYADACLKPIRRFCPIIAEELEGVAEGAGVRIEEMVLIMLRVELVYHGVLPDKSDHCTAFAVGPPYTADGNTYVGMNWDQAARFYGISQMILWQREEGSSVLGYSLYPGQWIGVGMNSAGIALTGTAPGEHLDTGPGPIVGIPSSLLTIHMLYQPTLEAAVEEARRVPRAGFFTFVMADGNGQLVNIEGARDKIAVEWNRGRLARVYYGSRKMTGTPSGKPVEFHPQCQRMLDLLDGSKGKIDQKTLLRFFGDHESTLCKHFSTTDSMTLDSMLYNTTKREVTISRGPGCLGRWKRFAFQTAPLSQPLSGKENGD